MAAFGVRIPYGTNFFFFIAAIKLLTCQSSPSWTFIEHDRRKKRAQRHVCLGVFHDLIDTL